MASLTACMVGNDTECGNSWNVFVMHCDGYNVARLKPEYNMTNCGRYCTGEQVSFLLTTLYNLYKRKIFYKLPS